MGNICYFKNQKHKLSFGEHSKNVPLNSYTDLAVIYLLTSTEHLQANYSQLFGKGYIDLKYIEEMGLSKGELLIVAFSLDLYNGHRMKGIDVSPSNVLSNLDDDLKSICLQAIMIRFNMFMNIQKSNAS